MTLIRGGRKESVDALCVARTEMRVDNADDLARRVGESHIALPSALAALAASQTAGAPQAQGVPDRRARSRPASS